MCIRDSLSRVRTVCDGFACVTVRRTGWFLIMGFTVQLVLKGGGGGSLGGRQDFGWHFPAIGYSSESFLWVCFSIFKSPASLCCMRSLCDEGMSLKWWRICDSCHVWLLHTVVVLTLLDSGYFVNKQEVYVQKKIKISGTMQEEVLVYTSDALV